MLMTLDDLRALRSSDTDVPGADTVGIFLDHPERRHRFHRPPSSVNWYAWISEHYDEVAAEPLSVDPEAGVLFDGHKRLLLGVERGRVEFEVVHGRW